jgi:Protein of unknown function (DUF1488)
MSHPLAEPHLVETGVAFVVQVEYVNHDCIVSKEALTKLSQQSKDTEWLATFNIFKAKICGVARRSVNAGVAGKPLLLGPNCFY